MPNTDHAEDILLELVELALMVERRLSESVEELDLGPELVSNASIATLFRLDLDGPMRPGHIGEMVGLTSGGVTKLLDRLESEHLIRRHYGEIPDDARGVEVRITDRGRRVADRLAEALSHHVADIRSFLDHVSDTLER
jgi:DNA-binding MarR family transcriptional regulator